MYASLPEPEKESFHVQLERGLSSVAQLIEKAEKKMG